MKWKQVSQVQAQCYNKSCKDVYEQKKQKIFKLLRHAHNVRQITVRKTE